MRRVAGIVLVTLAAVAGLAHVWRAGPVREANVERGAGGRREEDGAAGAASSPPVAPPRRGDGGAVVDAGADGGRSGRRARGVVTGIGVRPVERRAAERAASDPPPRPETAVTGRGAPPPRAVAVPPRGGARGSADAGGAEWVVETPAAPGDGGVLLSIPLRGAVEPEHGTGVPPRASGLVTDGEGVEFTEEAQYTLPAAGHVDGGAGTISFAIEPRWAGGDESNNSLLQIRDEHRWENSLGIVKNNNSLRYVIRDELGVETNVNVYIDAWQPNERHVVTATWDEERMTLAIDGETVGAAALPNRLRFAETTPIHVGSDFPGSAYRGANGRISDLTISATAPGAVDDP